MRRKQFISGAPRLACALVASLATCHVANAALTFNSAVGGFAPFAANRVNFDDLTPGGAGGTATGPSGSVGVSFVPDGAAVAGATANINAAPVLSGLNGIGFGSPNQPTGTDTTTYLTSGGLNASSKATLTFATDQKYFGLLWGSVDTYNTLTFYKDGDEVGSLTGAQVLAGANGNQTATGTTYVNVLSDLFFDSVVATSSSQYAFEFDNVAYSPDPTLYSAVPEPTTFVAGALLLLPFGAGVIRRMRNVSKA